MKKNAFLTFIFACIPGAGQMYYGYMKRGLSMITFFCLFIMAGTLVDVLVVGSVIVWMYSFFDTYDLIRHLAAEICRQMRRHTALLENADFTKLGN